MPIWQGGELKRETPRSKLAELAICFCEQGSSFIDNIHSCTLHNPNTFQDLLPEYLKSNSLPREMLDDPALRERMQGVLDLIFKFCEIKIQKDDLEDNLDELL